MNEGKAISILAGVSQKLIGTVGGEEGKMRILYTNKLRVLIEIIVERAVDLIQVFEEKIVSSNKLPKLMGSRCAFELQIEQLQILKVQIIYDNLANPLVSWFAKLCYYSVDS